jgi:predicted TPR repeat methyltransferase
MAQSSGRDKHDLDAAYLLRTPDDNRRFYSEWAESYDKGFVDAQDYLLPVRVADAFASAGGCGPVLDVGAGTGLVGARLAAHRVGPVDGVDISPEMLAKAEQKRVYSRLFSGNVLQRIDAGDGTYAGIVSSGTFTLGHVGPEALPELIRVARPGAVFVLSIRDAHYREAGFAAAFAALSKVIMPPELTTVRIYGQRADVSHRKDRAILAAFRTF